MTRYLFFMVLATCGYSTHACAEKDLCQLSFEKKDYENAKIVCSEMAQENPYAQYVLGEIGLDSSGRPSSAAMKWFLRAAGNNVVEAQRRLGELSQTGLSGSKNYQQARFWFEKAAEQGDSLSQANLGMMLISGCGGNTDSVSGLMWLQLSARQGNVTAEEMGEKTKNKMPMAQVNTANSLVLDWESRHSSMNNVQQGKRGEL